VSCGKDRVFVSPAVRRGFLHQKGELIQKRKERLDCPIREERHYRKKKVFNAGLLNEKKNPHHNFGRGKRSKKKKLKPPGENIIQA